MIPALIYLEYRPFGLWEPFFENIRKLLSIGNSLEYMYFYYHIFLSLGNGHLKKYM